MADAGGIAFGIRAFSLVELLIVVSILIVLIGLSAPLIGDALRGREMYRATTGLYDLIELARRQALVNQRYTYLCLANRTDEGGIDFVEAVIQEAKGSVQPTISPNDFRQESRVIRWKNIRLVSWSQLPEEVHALKAAAPVPSSLAEQPLIYFQVQGQAERSSYWCVLFSPQGYALFQPSKNTVNGQTMLLTPDINDPYERFVDISLAPSRGGTVLTDHPDHAAVLLNGVNGHVQILRR